MKILNRYAFEKKNIKFITHFLNELRYSTLRGDEHNVVFVHFTGGLLIALPREQAAAFCKDIEKQEGYQSWIIGIVEKGNKTARIIDKPRVIEVPAKDRDGELW